MFSRYVAPCSNNILCVYHLQLLLVLHQCAWCLKKHERHFCTTLGGLGQCTVMHHTPHTTTGMGKQVMAQVMWFCSCVHIESKGYGFTLFLKKEHAGEECWILVPRMHYFPSSHSETHFYSCLAHFSNQN